MKLTVYIDVLIVTNLIINYILIKISCLLSGTVVSTEKTLAASVAGVPFSLVFFFQLPWWILLFIRIVSIIIAVILAFGITGKYLFLKNMLCFIAANILFSGFILMLAQHSDFIHINNGVYYINISPVLLVISVLSVYAVITIYELVFSHPQEQIYNMDLYINEKLYRRKAFYDTGFRVRDILTNNTVVMCSYNYIKSVTDSAISSEIEKFFASGQYHSKRITPVFYSDISGKGMLPSVKADKIVLYRNNKSKELENITIAICNMDLPGEYQIIFGKELLNRTGI